MRFISIKEESLDMSVYKTYIAYRENLHVSMEAQLILKKFEVYKTLSIQVKIIKKERNNAQNRKQNVYFLMRIYKHEFICDTPVVFRI